MSDLTDTENKFTTHTMDTSSDHRDDKNLLENTMDTSSDQHEAAHNIVALENNELDSTTSEKSIGT